MMWFVLAVRNAIANLRRSAIGTASIALAVCVLVLFSAYVNAVSVGLKYSTIHGGTGDFQVSGRGGFDNYSDQPLKYGLAPDQQVTLEKAAATSPAVRFIAPRLEFGGLISNGPRTLSFAGLAVDPVSENAAFGRLQNIVAGMPLRAESAPDSVVLGVELARRLGVKPGDLVTLLSPTVSGALNAMDMVVVGLESTGIPQTDLFLLRAKLPAAQSLLATKKISTMAFVLNDDTAVPVEAKRFGHAAPSLEARTWIELTPIYRQIVSFYETIFEALGSFIVVLTLMGLAIIILTSVLERSREIGIMRSLGISQSRVRAAFLLEGFLLTLAGIALGTAVAALGSVAINAAHLTAPPPPGRNTGYPLGLLWDWNAVVVIWVAICVLSAIVSWFASGRVVKLRVVDALGIV